VHTEVHLYEREHAAQAVVLKGSTSKSDNHASVLRLLQ
jgi:hypothetical protein